MKNTIFIFTYDYFLKNGILLKLNENYFKFEIHPYKRIFKNIIQNINANIKNLDQKKNDYGFELINDLSIMYIKINDINTFILNLQLSGETKSVSQEDLENLINQSISNISNNTTDIVGKYYEENVLNYFLRKSKIEQQNIFPRLLLYMNFILLTIDTHNNIYIKYVPLIN